MHKYATFDFPSDLETHYEGLFSHPGMKPLKPPQAT